MSIALDPSKVNSEIIEKINKAKSAMQEAYNYSGELYNSLPSSFSYKSYTKQLKVNVENLKAKIDNAKTKINSKYESALNIEFNHSSKVNSLLTSFPSMTEINGIENNNFSDANSISSDKKTPSDSLGTKIASKCSSIFGRLKNQVVDVSQKVGTFCCKAKSAVCNAVEKAWDWVSDGDNWKRLGTKISNGAKSAWNFVTDKENYIKLGTKIADYTMDWIEDPVGTFIKTGASILNLGASFLKGLISLVEALGDFAMILVAVRDSIGTAILDEISYLWSGESLGLTENMWKKKVVPMVSYNWTNALDEKIGFRQWLDNYAYDAFKTDGIACQISEGVGYVTGIIVISALTFGAGGAAAAGTGGMSTAATAFIAGAAGMGKGTEEAWSQQADQKVLRIATEELNKEIEQGIVTQEMFDEKVKELLKQNPEIQLTEEDVSVAIYNDLLAKKVEEINKRPGARELTNDEIVGGLSYGTMTGVIDGVQWYAGQKINGLFRGSGTKITNKAVASLLRMGADTVDAVAEIPFRTYAQTLYRTDENGNKMSFSEVFEANGGWNQVKVQAGIAGVASGFGEAIDVTSSARNVKKMTSFLDGNIKPRTEITDKILDKVNKSISKMKDIDAKNYLESLDGVERVKAFDQMKINQQMSKSINSLDDISLKKFYDSLDEGKQAQILGMLDESKKSFLVAQSGDEVARSLSADQAAINNQKDSFNKDMEDIRNNDSLSEIEKVTQMRKIWEEDLKSLFGEENVMADEVDEVISKSSKVQQGVRWENSANERELIEKLYGKRDTLSPDTIAELEQNQYWQRIVKQNEENLQVFNTRFKNYSDTYSPRILTDDEILLAQRTMSDSSQLRDLRWTYMQRNLGIDMNNVPESILTAEVKSLDDALFQEIGSTNSYYRQVCIEDLIGSATKSGDAQTGYTFFEKMLLDKGYDINAKTHMFTDPVNALKSDFPDCNIGKEAMTGNRAIDLLEHNGKYYIGEDGNHRMVTLKVKFLAEMEQAVTAEEKALVRAKYTFTLPVKSLDLPIPDINSSSVANSISASTMADSVSATTIAENLNATTVADVTTMAKNIDDNLFDGRNLPLSNDAQLRNIQEKMLNGEDLTMFEKIRLRDHVETTIGDYALKENYAYRVVDEDAWNIYLKNKKIYSQSEDYILSADGMTSQGNGGCDWYLGGYASKYGTNGKSSYVIETPANKKYFQLARDNGNGMSDNVNVRHLKSFNTHDQVPLENVTKVFKIDPDGTITEINLKSLLDDEIEMPKLASEVKTIDSGSSLANEGNVVATSIVDDVAVNNISSSKVSINGIKNAVNNFSYKILSNPTISNLMVNPALPHLIANGDKVLGGFVLGTAFDMFKAKRTVTNVLDSANMTSQIKRDGIVHITSSNAADSIIDSGILKAATKKGKQIINQGQKTYFFKGGELDFDEVLVNVNTTPTLVGVKIKPSDSQLSSLGFRNLDDNALIHNGDFDLSGADSVEKVYYGLKLNEKTKKLYYSEISKQEYDNYKLDFNSYQTKMINNNFTETLLMLKSQLDIRRKRLLETVEGTNSNDITSMINEDVGIKNVSKVEINPFDGDGTYKKPDLSKLDDASNTNAAKNIEINPFDGDGTYKKPDLSKLDDASNTNAAKNIEINPFDGDGTYKKTDLSKLDDGIEMPKHIENIENIENFLLSKNYSKIDSYFSDKGIQKGLNEIDFDTLDINAISELRIYLAKNGIFTANFIKDYINKIADDDRYFEVCKHLISSGPINQRATIILSMKIDFISKAKLALELLDDTSHKLDVMSQNDFMYSALKNVDDSEFDKIALETLKYYENVLKTIDEKNIVNITDKIVQLKQNLNQKGITDDLAVARAVYMELGKELSYSELGTEITSLNYANAMNQSSLTNANRNVVCYTWASLYKEALVAAGIDEKNIKIMKYHDHHNVCFTANGKYFIADATYEYGGKTTPIDLLSIKLGRKTEGFYEIDSSIGKQYLSDSTDNQWWKTTYYNNRLDDTSIRSVDEVLGIREVDDTMSLFDDDVNFLEKQMLRKMDNEGTYTKVMFTDNEVVDTLINVVDASNMNYKDMVAIFNMIKPTDTNIRLATFKSKINPDFHYALISSFEDGKIKYYIKDDYGSFKIVDNIDDTFKKLQIDVETMKGSRY